MSQAPLSPPPRQPPRQSEETRRLAEQREQRLAEALRANLRRRKSQSRARAEGEIPAGTAEEADSAARS